MPRMCEGCGLKRPTYGLPAEGRQRWCAGCAAAHGGAVSLQQQKKCGLKGAAKRAREQKSETKRKLVGHLWRLTEKLNTMEKKVLEHKNEIAATKASIDNHTVRGTDRDCS